MPNPIPQACAIPFRRIGDELTFCLITSIKRGRWGFPKGIIEGDDSAEVTALKEAREEAGIRGQIVGAAVGEYRYQKWGTELDVTVFLMEVTQIDDEWPESEVRERDWVIADEAAARVADNESMAALFQAGLRQLATML